jgi:hypothetical protein
VADYNSLATTVPANTWTDVLLFNAPSGSQIPAGSSAVWAKVCLRDTSAATNTIKVRMYRGTYPTAYQIFDEAIVTVPASGYATVPLGPVGLSTGVDFQLKLDVFSTGACSVLNAINNNDDPQQTWILGLWLYP